MDRPAQRIGDNVPRPRCPRQRRWHRAALFAAALGPIAAALFAAAPIAPTQVPAEPYSLRLEVRGVDLWVAITDGRGRPVPAADVEAISVWEDGQPQEIDAVFPAAEVPLTLAIVLDCSSTMTEGGAIETVAEELGRFVDRTLRSEDLAALFTFRQTLTESVPFGTDRDALRAGISAARESAAELTFEGTAVRDAVADGLDRLAGHAGRRALLVITDGRDNGSETGRAALAERARHSRVRLYVLLVGRRQLGGELAAIADQTGGRVLRAIGPAALPGALRSIRRELTDQSIVSYRSSHAGDSDCRTVELAARRGDRSLRVRSPSGYCPSPSP